MNADSEIKGYIPMQNNKEIKLMSKLNEVKVLRCVAAFLLTAVFSFSSVANTDTGYIKFHNAKALLSKTQSVTGVSGVNANDSSWKSDATNAHAKWIQQFNPSALEAKDRSLTSKDNALQSNVYSLQSRDRTHDAQIADLYRLAASGGSGKWVKFYKLDNDGGNDQTMGNVGVYLNRSSTGTSCSPKGQLGTYSYESGNCWSDNGNCGTAYDYHVCR